MSVPENQHLHLQCAALAALVVNMANISLRFRIEGEGDNGSFFSRSVEAEEIEWVIDGKGCSILDASYDDQKEVVSSIRFVCAPKNLHEGTILWKCVAKGNISIWQNDPNKRVYRFWADSFYTFCLSKYVKCFKFTLGDIRDVLEFPTTELNLEANISHLEVTVIDISKEKNQLIRNPSDAVAVVVEDKDMGKEVVWLSKSLLSLESEYFRVMFNSDFNEKVTGLYSACDFDSSQFLHFLAIIHDLDNEISKYSVQFLLQMGDFYGCRKVIARCEEALKNGIEGVSPTDIFKLASRYALLSVLVEAVRATSVEQLKMIVKKHEHLDFCAAARELILERLCCA
ncbi:hypothetical protein QR680_010666 [Steinernema hermaphroditum]|uniref:BTB domain-containing protein n=1 Tax=Steinernema hermaphroditum TaxID=289476 RepID=A0AA39MC28_9BILA|nr:hypothetical protein QR680_010666 [Steinernema hermaphroditum]